MWQLHLGQLREVETAVEYIYPWSPMGWHVDVGPEAVSGIGIRWGPKYRCMFLLLSCNKAFSPFCVSLGSSLFL